MTSNPPPTGDDPRLSGLADQVRVELTAAGLPVLAAHDRAERSANGVSVEIDEGVWVRWNSGPELSAAAGHAFRVGAFQRDGELVHPAMRHDGVVADAMGEAIATILRALGYGVRAGVNDHDPYGLLVSAREPGPHWRDPAVPPLAGSAGYSPGVRVRLLAGEFAGVETTVVTVAFRFPVQGPPISYRVEHPGGTGELDVAPDDLTLAE